MAAQPSYQHVNFYFAVTFEGLGVKDIKSIDARFQSVTGLEAQIETETVKEGGVNGFEHTLPGRRKYSDLVLKRGLLTPEASSELTKWCLKAFEQLEVQPINLEVALLGEGDERPQTLCLWKVIHAWPKSWKMGELNAERGEVLIETLELSYNRFEFKAA
ncbi:phage tail protein [Spirosoma panaciterrae]|uniref:phage tail protein n=1 Tax=Spirosoma panaciterrae TaxID=496058 RepID=UPI000361C5E3|nr:phage tail protein [Spirosoma panaciterrae]